MRILFVCTGNSCRSPMAELYFEELCRKAGRDDIDVRSAGTGRFRPLADSKPFLGTPGTVEEVPEMKIETLCAAADLRAVIAAMREAHPYETPAFQFWPVGISEKEL